MAIACLTACGAKHDNPVLADSALPFGAPEFSKYKSTDYEAAFMAGFEEQRAEIDAIVADTAAPTFANTIEALERAFQLGYAMHTTAMKMCREGEYDILIIDIMMPELDGLSVCRALRRQSDVPVIFLTALSDEEDKLYGYNYYDAFKAFFVRNIANYANFKDYSINFVGSIAHYYRPVLEEAAASVGCKVGKVLQAPMEGLIAFHTEKN